MAEATTQEQTFGEEAVGLKFNPSGNMDVNFIKEHYARIIDTLHLKRSHSDDAETKRLCSIAITEAQGAQMWAVKAATWGLSNN